MASSSAGLSPGATATASLKVSTSDLASSISSDPNDSFPNVFATARMVALMEIASARVLQPYLAPGELSVGVTVEVGHTAPTPVDAQIIAEATYKERDGKLFVFDVVAKDEGGEIGKALHKRAIVDVARLEGKASKRVSASS
ncbi:unnamed protein product [Clonostachys byssicola]|uniref:Fluoroacetyl-CoA-specific thioesterase-like domain-containing protein n=1 Tax=Clonostachys byssicola TaxID=160290 RepID=A0A9N9Y819_9HYPO|nr:unnamed protein product [Clonostachys byssicola]